MELRLVLTVDDLDAALAVYRDALGLTEREMWVGEGASRGVLLDAGTATLELVNEAHAAAIDEAEVGRRVAGPVRVAFGVEDSEASAAELVRAGATQVAAAVTTPWRDRNVRLQAPDGMQLTLFSGLD
jgi:catechol 2,3-dioxygenase-like lactoylglutathione lyase family enzyme